MSESFQPRVYGQHSETSHSRDTDALAMHSNYTAVQFFNGF